MLPSKAQADTQAKGEWQGRFVSALKSPATPTPSFIASPISPSPKAQGQDKPSLNTPDRRFAVYRNNVFSSLVNSMADGFPVVQKLVGEEFFTALASAYVRHNLPTSPVMYFYGDTFGDFIDGFAPAASTPYLGDVARLEYARRVAMAAEDVAIVAMAQPAKVNANADAETKETMAQDLLDKTAQLHPSVRVMSSPYPIYSIWHRNTTSPNHPIPTDGTGEHVLIWRRGGGDATQSLAESLGESLCESPAESANGYVVETELLPKGGVEFFTAIMHHQPVYAAAEAADTAGGGEYLPQLLQRMLSVTTKLENPLNLDLATQKETTPCVS